MISWWHGKNNSNNKVYWDLLSTSSILFAGIPGARIRKAIVSHGRIWSYSPELRKQQKNLKQKKTRCGSKEQLVCRECWVYRLHQSTNEVRYKLRLVLHHQKAAFTKVVMIKMNNSTPFDLLCQCWILFSFVTQISRSMWMGPSNEHLDARAAVCVATSSL